MAAGASPGRVRSGRRCSGSGGSLRGGRGPRRRARGDRGRPAGHPARGRADRRGGPAGLGHPRPARADPPALRPRRRPGGRAAPRLAAGDRRSTGAAVEPTALSVDWDLEAAQKGGYDDFMSKEIHEQPQAVADTLLDRRQPDGSPRPRRAAADRGRPAVGRQGVHRGLRQQLPRRHGGQVRHRALDPPADRGRHRQRVPLPRPGAGRPDPGRRGQPVGRDPRHPAGPARGPALGVQGAGGLQRGRLVDGPGGRRRALHPGRARGRGGVHQVPPGPDRGPGDRWPSPWPSCAGHAARRRRSAALLDQLHELPGQVAEALARAKEVDVVAGAVAERPGLLLPRPRRRLPGGPGGRPQAEGDLLPAGRGLPGGRAQARPDRPDRARDGGGGGGHPQPASTRRCWPTWPRWPAGGPPWCWWPTTATSAAAAVADHVLWVPPTEPLLSPGGRRGPAPAAGLPPGPHAWATTSTVPATWPRR